MMATENQQKVANLSTRNTIGGKKTKKTKKQKHYTGGHLSKLERSESGAVVHDSQIGI